MATTLIVPDIICKLAIVEMTQNFHVWPDEKEMTHWVDMTISPEQHQAVAVETFLKEVLRPAVMKLINQLIAAEPGNFHPVKLPDVAGCARNSYGGIQLAIIPLPFDGSGNLSYRIAVAYF
jgi:hypothetical protein